MEIGEERIYNSAFMEKGKDNVILWDIRKISDGQQIRVKFISKNTHHKSGIWLQADNGISIPSLGKESFPSITLWDDTAPTEVICKCYSTNGNLSIYNVWDEGDGRESQAFTSGMLVHEVNGLLVYNCNNYGFETNFDDLIFSIEFL